LAARNDPCVEIVVIRAEIARFTTIWLHETIHASKSL